MTARGEHPAARERRDRRREQKPARPLPPFRAAQADALEMWARSAPRFRPDRGIRFTRDAQTFLAQMGLARAVAERAANDLVKAGRATLTVEEGVVVLRVKEPRP